jgi:hypothetical protein
MERLRSLLVDIGEDRLKSVEKLIGNAAFMAVTLEDLQDEINKKGPVSEYQNGENQWGTKKSPEIEIYNTMVKNYMAAVKQLTDLLPSDAKPPSDALLEFVSR